LSAGQLDLCGRFAVLESNALSAGEKYFKKKIDFPPSRVLNAFVFRGKRCARVKLSGRARLEQR
jgi:hypothetical protein